MPLWARLFARVVANPVYLWKLLSDLKYSGSGVKQVNLILRSEGIYSHSKIFSVPGPDRKENI